MDHHYHSNSNNSGNNNSNRSSRNNYPATMNAAAAASLRRLKENNNNHSIANADFCDIHAIDVMSPTSNNSTSIATNASSLKSSSFNRINDPIYRSIPFNSNADFESTNDKKNRFHYSDKEGNKQTFMFPKIDSNKPGFITFDPLVTKLNVSETETKKKQKAPAIRALPIPILIEKNSNVLVSGSLDDIAQSVSELLQKHGVDISFKPEKCKWVGVAYSHNRELSLRAFLYKAPNENLTDLKDHYILEFQRREGSAMDFSSLYQEIYGDLLKTGFVVQKSQQIQRGKRPNKMFAPLPLPEGLSKSYNNNSETDSGSKDNSDDLNANSFSSLISLVQSPYIESQRESLRSVANMASNDEKKRKILATSSDLLETLVDNLISTDSEVCRLSCSALESFSKDSNIVPLLSSSGLMHRVCQILASPRLCIGSKAARAKCTKEGYPREIRRIASKIALNMVTSVPDMLHRVSGSLVLFRSLGLNEDEDPIIKQSAQSIIKITTSHHQ